jgi:hypothetical protein
MKANGHISRSDSVPSDLERFAGDEVALEQVFCELCLHINLNATIVHRPTRCATALNKQYIILPSVLCILVVSFLYQHMVVPKVKYIKL